MITDNSLYFSSAQAITSASAASTNTFDVTGAGYGNAPSALTFGSATVFGDDIGLGDGVAYPYLVITVPTAFTTSSSATLQFSLQAGVDNGSNAVSTWYTIWQSPAYTAAQLPANSATIVPVPPRAIPQGLPRFYRVYYTLAVGTMTAGTVTSFLTINPSSIVGAYTTFGAYPNNFTVAN